MINLQKKEHLTFSQKFFNFISIYIEFAHLTIVSKIFAAIDFLFRHEMRYNLFIYLFICIQCFQLAESTNRIIGRETK